MASVNKVILIGNLGKDPDLRFMPAGDAVCNITIATTEEWKDKQSGEKKSITEWHRVVFFRKLAEIAGEYLKKGSQVYIEGSLKTRKWEKDGHTNYTTEIVADTMKMLGSRQDSGARQPDDGGAAAQDRQHRDGGASTQRPAAGGSAPQQGGGFADFEDDIPF